MTLPAPILALVVAAIEPQRLGNQYWCRICSRVTTTREAALIEHRLGCEVPQAREWMADHDAHRP